MNADTRIALLQILEDRYEKKSVIIASQLPVDKWYDYIAEATLADAIMDRLVKSDTCNHANKVVSFECYRWYHLSAMIKYRLNQTCFIFI